MHRENKSKSGISYSEAQRIAISIGAVMKGDYSPFSMYNIWTYRHEPVLFSTHYFNKEKNEIGYYSHDLNSFNDTRDWNDKQNGTGRIWCPIHKERLINKQVLK